MLNALDDALGVMPRREIDLWMTAETEQFRVVVADDDPEGIAGQHLLVVTGIAGDETALQRATPLQREVAQRHPFRGA